MKIILFRGRPGTGKTTLSNAFAKMCHFPIFRKDDIYDSLYLHLDEHDKRSKLSYEILYKILETNLNNNSTFILDFPFQNSADYSIIEKWTTERNINFKSILVTCSDEKLWAERFNIRAENPAPNQLITNFDELKEHYVTLQIDPEQGELVVDTVESVESNILRVVEFI